MFTPNKMTAAYSAKAAEKYDSLGRGPFKSKFGPRGGVIALDVKTEKPRTCRGETGRCEGEEKDTRKITEELNEKIAQLKAKYAFLVDSKRNSPTHSQLHVERTEEKPHLRKHCSQENLHSEGLRGEVRGILKQTSRFNIPKEKLGHPIETTSSNPTNLGYGCVVHSHRQSAGSLQIKMLIEQARNTPSSNQIYDAFQKQSCKENQNYIESGLEEKRPFQTSRNNSKEIPTEIHKIVENTLHSPYIFRNPELSKNQSLPRGHVRAKSDCVPLKGKGILSAEKSTPHDEYMAMKTPGVARTPACSVHSKAEDSGETSLSDREKLIRYNRRYVETYNEIPPTTTDYYKFVKLIGKGAFGKVTLGIHKLTGKYVAIKNG